MVLFKRRLIHKIRQGQKTQTRRTHKRTWKVGRMYAIRDRWFGKPLGHIKIVKKFQQKLGEISLEDVKKEGFNSLEDFRKAWTEINAFWDPEQIVTVYEFAYVEKPSSPRKGKPSLEEESQQP
jgi:hypothetical protein